MFIIRSRGLHPHGRWSMTTEGARDSSRGGEHSLSRVIGAPMPARVSFARGSRPMLLVSATRAAPSSSLPRLTKARGTCSRKGLRASRGARGGGRQTAWLFGRRKPACDGGDNPRARHLARGTPEEDRQLADVLARRNVLQRSVYEVAAHRSTARAPLLERNAVACRRGLRFEVSIQDVSQGTPRRFERQATDGIEPTQLMFT